MDGLQIPAATMTDRTRKPKATFKAREALVGLVRIHISHIEVQSVRFLILKEGALGRVK